MATGIIDQLWISLGYKTDTSGLKEMKRNADEAKSSMMDVGRALKAIAVGFVVKGIADIGSAWEQNRIQIAGYFTALGQSTDFTSALHDADTALNLITIAAAKLPGEAEEYQEVFKDTFSFVKGAVGGSIEEMTTFTNTLTAIGKAGKLDAAQIGREANELLAVGNGRAAARNRLWMQFFPLLRHLEGQANLTSASFNAMTQQKRAQLLQKAFAGLQPMLDASADSFDAMWGAMKSGIKILVRLGTSGLFEAMKSGLNQVNALFFDSKGAITAFGQSIVDNFKMVSGWVIELGRDVGIFAVELGKLWKQGVLGKAMFIGLAAAVIGFKRALTGGVIALVILLIDDLYKFFSGNESLIGLFLEKWPKAMAAAAAALGVLGAALVAFHVLSATSMTGIALALGGAFLPIFGAILGTLALIAALAVLYKSITNIAHHWDEFKLMLKLPGAKIKDLITGGGEHFEDQVRAQMGAARENVERKDAAASGLANTTGAMNGPLSAPGGYNGLGPFEGPGDRDERRWQRWEPPSMTVNAPSTVHIQVDGSKDPQATAKAVADHLERRDRATIRNAKSKVGL